MDQRRYLLTRRAVMRQGVDRTLAGVLLLFGVGLQGCYTVPDLHGVYLSRHVRLDGDQRSVEEIVATFKRAEEAMSKEI